MSRKRSRQLRVGPHFVCLRCDVIVDKYGSRCWMCGENDRIEQCIGPAVPGEHLGCAACAGDDYPKPRQPGAEGLRRA